MNHPLEGLTPAPLWEHFYRITTIPRPSGHEERIAGHVLAIARDHHLEAEQDRRGNVRVRKPASPGGEHAAPLALQTHLDMVCEKNSTSRHNFETDPIPVRVNDGYVTSDGTTLGADNGIGVATALAVLLDPSLVHGPLECLFTVDEETGLTGAHALSKGFLESRILLNLDSEEEGALYVGCSGGRDTILTLPVTREPLPQGFVPLGLHIGGLRGGHSGLDIVAGRGNAIKLLARALRAIVRHQGARIASIAGGSKRNAIPRECDAAFVIRGERLKSLRDQLDHLLDEFRTEFGSVEPGLTLSLASTRPAIDGVLHPDAQRRFLHLLEALPHGVIRMSPDIEGLVETSTNVATVAMEGQSAVIGTSQRSSIAGALDDIVATVDAIGALASATVTHTDGYPGWKPDMASPLLRRTRETYVSLFGAEPAVKAIHAGLECGIIGETFRGIDMVSFGPTIEGAHSPDERVYIASVGKFWTLLVRLLANLADRS